jgi:hypothetical protein
MKLNLGCGFDKLDGWVNVDNNWKVNPDKYLDVTHVPWQFTDAASGPEQEIVSPDSVQYIRADNLFEHLATHPQDELMIVLNECWNVLKRGGELWMRVPDFTRWPEGALRDPTHCRFFVETSFDYWDFQSETWKQYGSQYGYLPWKIIGKKIFENPTWKPGLKAFFWDVTMEPYKE